MRTCPVSVPAAGGGVLVWTRAGLKALVLCLDELRQRARVFVHLVGVGTLLKASSLVV